MVLTTLEAHVAEAGWARLRDAYLEGQREVPPQMVRSYLVQGVADPTLWQILTVWTSREALDEMRRSVAVPAGVLMFRSAGAEPTLTVTDVRDTISVASPVPR